MAGLLADGTWIDRSSNHHHAAPYSILPDIAVLSSLFLDRLRLLGRAFEPLLEAGQVVVDGAVGLGGHLGAVHAGAQGLLDGGAAGRRVACRGPACCA